MSNPQLPLGIALRESARFDCFFGGRFDGAHVHAIDLLAWNVER